MDAEEVVNAATASMSNVQSAEVAGRATWTPPAAGDPSLSVAAASASEVSRFLGFSVTLGAESSQTVMVEFSTSDETDDAAEAGIDYTAVSGTLIFPPGTTERLVNVPITDDRIAESDETFTLNVSAAVHASLTAASVKGTIQDDETAGVTVTPTSLTITEGASDAYTVVLTTPPPADVMVTLSVPGAGGFTADPAVLTFSSTTWDTAQTVTVSATEDADAVAPAPATIGHSAAGGGYDAVTVEGVLVTVTENDAAGVTVTPTSLTIMGGRERHVHGGVDDAADGERDGDAVGAGQQWLHGGPVGADVQLDDLGHGADRDGVGDGGRRRCGACAGDDRPPRGRGRLRLGDRRGRGCHGDRGRRGRRPR